jgi:AraC-like DNA-binding protein/mannose-6-phosphate isomerase-like protein (cupin superfamily)
MPDLKKQQSEDYICANIVLPSVDIRIYYALFHTAITAEFIHRHHYHHIITVISGRLNVRCAQEIIPLNRGDLILLAPQVWHNFVNPQEEKLEYFVISFDLSMIFDKKNNVNQIERMEFQQIYDFLKSAPSYCCAQSKACLNILDNIQPAAEEAAYGRNVVLVCDYIKFIIAAINSIRQSRDLTPKRENRSKDFSNANIAIEIAQYLHSHYQEDIHIETISQRYNFTVRHLQRIFNEFFGTSFAYSLTLIRLNAAKKYLLGSNATLDEVAGQVGFPSVRAFKRAFKENEGVTPAEYRTLRAKDSLPKGL